MTDKQKVLEEFRSEGFEGISDNLNCLKALDDFETLVREEQKQVFERFRINVRSECKKEITMMELDMEKIRMFSELAERQRIKKGVEGLRPRIWNSVHDSGYEKAINDVLKIVGAKG